MATTITLSGGQVLRPDTATVVNHGTQSEVTVHPVEDGSEIADHVVHKPNTVTLSTEWTPRPPDDTWEPTGDERPAVAFDILSRVVQSGATVAIDVDGVLYAPAVISRCSMARAFEDGDGRTIQIDAVQVQIVAGRTVAVRLATSLRANGKRRKANAKAKALSAAYAGVAEAALTFEDISLGLSAPVTP